MKYLLNYLHLFINKLISSIYLLFILSWGAQPFVIQTYEIKSVSGILLQNSKFNYTHLSGHILGYFLPLLICRSVDLDL